jgi:hypothetical protein
MRHFTERLATALALCLILLAAVSPHAAQAPRTNDDRKTECRKNLNGQVFEYSDGGFACTAGTVEATIHCTSGGQCLCTGAGCDQIGGDGALGKLGNAKKKILATLPLNIPAPKRAQLVKLVDESLKALHKRDGKTASQKIEELLQMRQQLDWGGAIACKDKCKHHLDDGNPEKYAVCWYACLIFDVRKV